MQAVLSQPHQRQRADRTERYVPPAARLSGTTWTALLPIPLVLHWNLSSLNVHLNWEVLLRSELILLLNYKYDSYLALDTGIA